MTKDRIAATNRQLAKNGFGGKMDIYARQLKYSEMFYDMLCKKDSACLDYNKAKENGDKNADRKIKRCKENTPESKTYFSLLRLTTKAKSDQYGFAQEDPIKVGVRPNGGPAQTKKHFLTFSGTSKGKQ